MSKSAEYEAETVITNISNTRLNAIRASVLGANDGIVSTAGLVVGVASATGSQGAIFVSGVASIVAGALSIAASEYVSSSSQRDSQRALLEREKELLEKYPIDELEELTLIYQTKGLSRRTAKRVAKELTKEDAFAAHADAEHGINLNDITRPWRSALASACSFAIGATIPLLAISAAPTDIRIPVTFAVVASCLALTGAIGAKAGNARPVPAALRIVIWGIAVMIITSVIGSFIDTSL